MHESDFIDAINADPDDRFTQLVYADWLDEQGDPLAEGWRVLIEAGKRPDLWEDRPGVPRDFIGWGWSFWEGVDPPSRNLNGFIEHSIWNSEFLWKGCKTFWHAMNRVALAWVRANRDPVSR
jgi:uncharacterized protein (TIGR02996 family)